MYILVDTNVYVYVSRMAMDCARLNSLLFSRNSDGQSRLEAVFLSLVASIVIIQDTLRRMILMAST